MSFSSLHNHTMRSPIDSVATIDSYILRAQKLGIQSMATSEHGRISGFRDNMAAQEKHGFKVIQGIETYFSSTDRFDRRPKKQREDGSSVYNHLILLAMNNQGLKNLFKINELAWTEGFYSQARMDIELLEKYGDNLIVLSGCMSGVISEGILQGDYQKAVDWAGRFKKVLGDRFFIELQSENDVELNQGLLKVADEIGIKPVITEDSHMSAPEDRWIEEAFLILSTRPNAAKGVSWESLPDISMLEKFNMLYPDRKMTFEHLDLYMAGREHREAKLKEQGIDRPELFDNTLDISNRINTDYDNPTGLDLLPRPKAEDPITKLRQLCRRGMKQKGLTGNEAYEARLKHELEVIESKGFSTYFLVVADMMAWITSQGMQKGFGRGSSAGSLVAYVTGITMVDPLPDDLLFERFIDETRDDMPDVDSDTSDQPAVREYLRRTHGHVANITTVNYFQEKSSLKDAASIIKVPFAEANRVIKNVEGFEDYLNEPEFKVFREKYPDVYKIAQEFNGKIRGYGMHAAGIVVSSQDFTNYMPIESRPAGDGRIPVVAYDGDEVAAVGGVKIDCLGLSTLAVVKDCLDMINTRHYKKINIESIPRDDPNVFADINEGHTRGLFQAEQSASTRLIVEMGVDGFNDLVVSNALVRTGAYKAFGKEYISRKRGKHRVKKIHPIYDEITKDTLGLPLYQESWMRIMNELAGMNMGTVNKVRKLTAKKKSAEELAPFKNEFVNGVSEKADQETADFLWEWLLQTSAYNFNKSHAVAYSMLTNTTAWLKHYYPLEYMLALLRNEKDKDAVTDYFIEAKRLGIKILLPHVNKSKVYHDIEGEDSIRMGLSSIKYVSDLTAPKLLRYGPFKDYKHLYESVMEKGNGLTVRTLQGLNAIGAATFDDNPKKGNERDNLYEYLGIPAFKSSELPPKIKYQMDSIEDVTGEGIFKILGMVRGVKNGDGWSRADIIDETGSIGLFTNNPLVEGQMYIFIVTQSNILGYVTVDEVIEKKNTPIVEYLYRMQYPNLEDKYKVINWESRKTKKGANMATVLLSTDDKELQEALVFDRLFLQAYSMCKPGNVVVPEFGKMKDGTVILNDVKWVK